LKGAFVTRGPGPLRNDLEKGPEEVGVVVRRLAVQHCGEAFESHTRVDVLARQRVEASVNLAVVFHEDQVPNLGKFPVLQKALTINFRFLRKVYIKYNKELKSNDLLNREKLRQVVHSEFVKFSSSFN
jgi:hypothetical protein